MKKALAGLLIFCLAEISACKDKEDLNQHSALDAFNNWVLQNQSPGSDSCHAYGLIKHPETNCEEMLNHAGEVIHETRVITSIRSFECFGSICGEFVELEIDSKNMLSQSVKEIAVLKKDNNVFKLYWYRTNSLLTVLELRAKSDAKEINNSGLEAKEEQLNRVYIYLTNKIPELYQYPVCLEIRVTSLNLIGNLMPVESVTLTDFTRRSKRCDKRLCIGMIGKKVAAVCDKAQ